MRALAFFLALLACLLCAFHSPAWGQQIPVVFPIGFDDVEGNEGSDGTGSFPEGIRVQQVFSASQFLSFPDSHRTIVGLRWRPDGDFSSPVTYDPAMTLIRLSTTTKNPGELSPVFSQNVGMGETIVLNAPQIWSTENIGPPGGPKAFDFVVDFATPFYYDPTSQENLLIDWIVTGPAAAIPADADNRTVGLTQLISNTDPNAMTGQSTTTSIIHQFIFVPEPTSIVLALVSGLVVSVISRQRIR